MRSNNLGHSPRDFKKFRCPAISAFRQLSNTPRRLVVPPTSMISRRGFGGRKNLLVVDPHGFVGEIQVGVGVYPNLVRKQR